VQNVVTYAAILAVDNAELLLRPGMTAAATIVIETKRATLSVPNAALRFAPSPELRKQLGMPDVAQGRQKTGKPELKGVQVWTVDGFMPKANPVSVGVSDGAFTELLGDALKPGTELIVDVEEKKR
jgi:HlyD family secretion protein